jgi:hypothetical protein
MDPFSPVVILAEAIVGLIVAAVIAIGSGVVRKLPRGILTTLRPAALRSPTPISSVLRRAIYRIYPDWPTVIGATRSQKPTAARIHDLRTHRKGRFYILGGVYLDISLAPIDSDTLEQNEYSILDRVEPMCGGSAMYVGRFLHSEFHEMSSLYTRLGSGDVLSDTLRKLLRDEQWIRRPRRFDVEPDKQSGISAHLIGRSEKKYTTFTHTGALGGLEWGPVLTRLARSAGPGGVLHISGYFRTGLHDGLTPALRNLSPHLLVCIDHGRFHAEHNRRPAEALLESFRSQLVDIYICTLPELRTLMRFAEVEDGDHANQQDLLDRYARSDVLPKVTVVRCERDEPFANAHVLVDDQVLPVRTQAELGHGRYLPGRNNAFNAALIYHLSKGDPNQNLSDAVTDSVAAALKFWSTQA